MPRLGHCSHWPWPWFGNSQSASLAFWPLLLLLTKLEVCSLLLPGDTDLWLFSWRAHQAPLLPPAGHPHALFSSQRVSTTQLHLPGVKVASIKIMFQSLNETSSFWGGLGSGVERWCVILIRKLSTDGNIPPVDLNPTEWYGAGCHVQFSSVQLLSHVQLFSTPWTVACQASLSITNS